MKQNVQQLNRNRSKERVTVLAFVTVDELRHNDSIAIAGSFILLNLIVTSAAKPKIPANEIKKFSNLCTLYFWD